MHETAKKGRERRTFSCDFDEKEFILECDNSIHCSNATGMW